MNVEADELAAVMAEKDTLKKELDYMRQMDDDTICRYAFDIH
jgi:hypothetical protein